MNQATEFDAIVIGSGITGGWAAKELTEKGLKVLILERGKPLEHQKGYVHEFRTATWTRANMKSRAGSSAARSAGPTASTGSTTARTRTSR
jgi:choline dehydrogenase-like flavoprotein